MKILEASVACLGIILGVVVWQRSGLEVDTSLALAINVGLQMIAACIDFSFSRIFSVPGSAAAAAMAPSLEGTSEKYFSWRWYAVLTAIAVTLTIAHQIVTFGFVHWLDEKNFGELASDLLAAGYVGSALAAIFCAYTNPELFMNPLSRENRFGRISLNLGEKVWRFSPITFILLCLCFMAFALGGGMMGFPEKAIVLGIVAAGFFYEILLLVILNCIGSKSKSAGKQGLVALSYGIMGFSASIALIFYVNVPSPMIVFLITLPVCGVIAAFLFRKVRRYDADFLKTCSTTANRI